ncbi:hypothetical protein ACIHEJ_08960 [Streptomyces sp. NPDC052301]|uniref:hypothetical protein n=1 Tax=Streptomyces sp. NPDC052301 TaxID=3365687 RepID=UPI0037D1B98E
MEGLRYVAQPLGGAEEGRAVREPELLLPGAPPAHPGPGALRRVLHRAPRGHLGHLAAYP